MHFATSETSMSYRPFYLGRKRKEVRSSRVCEHASNEKIHKSMTKALTSAKCINVMARNPSILIITILNDDVLKVGRCENIFDEICS
jgi:hypothetical protein